MPFLQISNWLSTIYKHSVPGKLFIVHISVTLCHTSYICDAVPHLICQGFGTYTRNTATRVMTVVGQHVMSCAGV